MITNSSSYKKKLAGKICKLNNQCCLILKEINYSSDKKQSFILVLLDKRVKVVSRDFIKIL